MTSTTAITPTTTSATMNDDMTKDATETSFGICAYRSPTVAGFSAVLKGRFSDFLVHEVSLDGVKAELTSMNGNILQQQQQQNDDTDNNDDANDSKTKKSQDDNDKNDDDNKSDRKRKRQEENDDDDDNNNAKPKNDDDTMNDTQGSTLDWPTLETELTDLLHYQEDGTGNSRQYAQQVLAFLQNTNTTTTEKFVALPTSTDKAHRRALHEWIRARLTGHALADTAEGSIRIWKLQFAAEMPNYGKFDQGRRGGAARSNHKQRPPPSAKFLRFVIYKENLDTNSALQQIQRRCGGGGGGGRHKKHRGSLRLGFAGMKDKRGVTAQFVTMPARSVSIEHLVNVINHPRSNDAQQQQQKAGGGHTDAAGVAVMRIGNFSYVNDDLRLGRLLGNRFDVVLRNVLAQPPGDDNQQTKQILGQAAKALGTAGFINYFGVQRFGKYCDTHLVGIALLKQDFAKAVDLILQPKPDERENTRLARQAWQERFAKLDDDKSDENTLRKSKETAEKDCATRILKDFGRFHNNEVAVLKVLQSRPLDYRKAINSVTKTMRMMFVHALQSYLFNHAATFRLQTLGDQVIEGDLVLDGPIDINQSGIPKVRKVTAEDVAQKKYSLEDVFLPLMGCKTMDPDDETAKIYTKLLAEHGLTRESFDIKDRDLNCAGDYRKLIVRPTDVDYEVIEYTDPRQPLVQTDLMKLQGIAVQKAPPDAENPLVAMRVGFTLPPSAYATIALRELMKRPTSSDYQKELSLDS